jgi:hypothetical protein
MTPEPARPRRLDLLPPPPDTTPDPALPTTAERALVILGLWVVPILNTVLLAAVLVILLRG